ncbi:hypothetical protein [Streptomyces sp. NPDC015130]|uniref:hypothetical protein n=1 Tax=Streptomyces sp. NPDC015130 TaxID=3364940 RepID=UPI0036FF18C5
MLPTGVAVAGTPVPPPVSAAPGPETEPTPEPTPTVDPTPEPTPTSDATSEPTPAPSSDPTPSTPQTVAPTDDPSCPALPLAPFGNPGDAVGRATLAPDQYACFTVTVARPGLHRILLDGSATVYVRLTSGGTPVTCELITTHPCELAAGTYRLTLQNYNSATYETSVAVVPLMAGPGCSGSVSTDYGTGLVTGSAASRLALFCHPFTASPGALITADLDIPLYERPTAWITDDSGKQLCEAVASGCVLPSGNGGYRLLVLPSSRYDSRTSYALKLRRLSDPIGCATVAASVYGSVPAPVSPATDCKTFTPATTASYEMETVSTSDRRPSLTVHTTDGRRICESTSSCTLTAGVAYLLLTDGTVRIIDTRSAEGCTDDIRLGLTVRGAFSARDEVDCLNVPLPRGARMALLKGYAPDSSPPLTDVTVLDATGVVQCDDTPGTDQYACALGGTAPYRAIVRNRSDEPPSATGPYALAFHRIDAAGGCPALPAGDFTSSSPSAKVTTGEDAFSGCYTIPADAHSARELITVRSVSGASTGELHVYDQNGTRACEEFESDAAAPVPQEACALTAGHAYTALVLGLDTTAEFALTRRDVTATARGCVTTPATPVGRPSVAGVPGSYTCHRVTTPDARDTLHVNPRYTSYGSAHGLGVYRPNGAEACDDPFFGCAVDGSTSYQLIVKTDPHTTTTPAYRLDALRIGTAAGPAPECVKVPNVSYGFGPLVATLSEQKTAICAVLPTMSGDSFAMPQASGTDLPGTPIPRLYTLADRQDGCTERHYEGRYECEVPPTEDEWYPVSRPAVLLIGMPSRPTTSSVPVSAKFSCMHAPCGSDARTIGTVTPGTVGAGKITMKVSGTALHEKDVVELTSGSYRARSTTVSVAADRRSMVVALDLTSAPRTKLYATVVTHDAERFARGQITVVAPLRATAAPKVTGTVVVGGKVTATSGSWSPTADTYAYQWRANGVIIAGATASSYTVPSTLQGKQLSVSVTARKAGHPAVTSASAATTVKGVAPKATKAPYTTGTVKVGRTLTLNRGTWTPAPSSYAYQWYANGRAISGATKAWFTLTSAQRGTKITVRVTAYRTGHLNGVAWTRATSAVVG